MKKTFNLITFFASIILAFIVGLYLFTPIFDEWVIQKSLDRFCATQKKEFSGEFYSPAYLCTFIEGTK